jgi:hypothetical protein
VCVCVCVCVCVFFLFGLLQGFLVVVPILSLILCGLSR